MNPMIAFIEHLLYTHDCVIIPHFGGFVLNTQDFKLDDEQVIHPKSKWVAFNERLQSDDGLLATSWAKENGISQKQAFAAVHRFGQTLSAQIKADKQFQFGNIGVFQVSKSGRLQFEPNQLINFDLNQYGLMPVGIGQAKKKPVLQESPVEKSAVDLPTVQPPVKRTRQNQFYTYVLMAFFFGGIAAYYLTEPNSRYVNSSFSPLTIRIKKTKPAAPAKIAVIEVPKKEAIATVQEEITAPVSGGIFLVAGSFKTEAKAATCQAELVAKGFENVQIIEKQAGEGHYRVSVGEVADFDAGYAAATRLKTEKKLDIWVYKR
ncbi:HU domain-containing protein [Aquirufa regiilacus]|nr:MULTISPECIES: SPOR domain-containing protein [unclassified Aquirufa]MDT8887331.1 SPOR domain-containing protein [Aquirufa sp. LEPPI-3A]